MSPVWGPWLCFWPLPVWLFRERWPCLIVLAVVGVAAVVAAGPGRVGPLVSAGAVPVAASRLSPPGLPVLLGRDCVPAALLGTAPALPLLLVFGGFAAVAAPPAAVVVHAPYSVVIGVVAGLEVLLIVCVGSHGRMWWLVDWGGVVRVGIGCGPTW